MSYLVFFMVCFVSSFIPFGLASCMGSGGRIIRSEMRDAAILSLILSAIAVFFRVMFFG